MKTTFENLREFREDFTAMRPGFVARRTAIPLNRLNEIEQNAALATIDELERLAILYGVDADILEKEPISLAYGDGIACLALAPEFREIGDSVRAKITAVANVARDLCRLEEIMGSRTPRWERFCAEAPRLKPMRQQSAAPYRQGAYYASKLRTELGLGSEPIESMLRFVREHFPSVVVLHARLTAGGPAGLAFMDRVRGPTIVLNLEGKNSNACVRRVSLAHELCHMLVDWTRKEPLATISGYLSDSSLEVEQRANAFAIRLLCPESVVSGIDTSNRSDLLGRLSVYGLPYSAIRLYVKNHISHDIGRKQSAEDLELLRYTRWASMEEDLDLDRFPLVAVPHERRTAVARNAANAYSQGLLTRSSFAAFLGVSPLEDIERVLDFYDVDMLV